MKPLYRIISNVLVGLIFVLVMGLPGHAQPQTPTQPSPTPDLNTLREQLKQSLQGASGQPGQAGAQPGTPGYTQKSKKGTKEDKKTANKAAEGQPPQPGAAPGARGKAGAKTAGKPTLPKTGAPKPGGQGGGVRTMGGPTGGNAPGGGGVSAVRVVGQGTYEPLKDKTLEYGEVPDAGEPMTLNGPLPVKEFLDTLALATNWNVLVTEEAQKVNLQFWITETKPKDALEILKFYDVYYEYKEDTKYLYVMTKQEFLDRKYGTTQEEEFVVKHASVDYIESVLTSLLSEKGRILTDPRTQHLLVWDARDNVDKMKKTVAELDVPLDEMQFKVRYADIADIEAVLNTLLSQAGTLVSDPRTGSILVKDLKANIEQMQAALEKLDVTLELRVFSIQYVAAENLVDSVQALLTERGTLQSDAHSNTLIVTDVPSRLEKVAELVKTLDRKLDTRTWVLKYLDVDDVSERIEPLVPEEMGSIVTDEDVHQITVTAVPERIEEIDGLIKSWDIKRRQVQIEAYLLTVTSDLERKLTIDWQYFDSTGNAPQAFQVNGGAMPDYTKPTGFMMVGQVPYAKPLKDAAGAIIKDLNGKTVVEKFRGNRVAAMLDYLDTRGEATLISTPRLTVQDGEEAVFKSGSQIPYVASTTYGSGYGSGYGSTYPTSTASLFGGTTSTTTATTTTGTTTTPVSTYSPYGYGNSQPYNSVQFMEVGTILNVLPRISEDGSIQLDIKAEDSSADINNKVISNGQENTVPLKKQSQAETQVRVQDGQTIVIGGLRTGSTSSSMSKSVPILSDLPLIGRLFKSPSRSSKNDNLMIFITTTIVGENTQPDAEKLAAADDKLASDVRKDKKDSFGRFFQNLRRGKNEIVVSIGQSGSLRCGGKKVTMDELRKKLSDVEKPSITKVVIRKHPRSPEEVVAQITEMAMDNMLKVEFDESIDAFVPDYGAKDKEAPGATAEPKPAESPSAPEAKAPAEAPAPTTSPPPSESKDK